MRKIFLILSAILIGVMIAIPAITQEDVTETTLVRVAHFSPDTSTVDIYVDGELALSGLSYPDVTDWIEITAGTYSVAVVPSGSAIEDAAIGPADFTLAANQRVTVSAIGSSEAGTLTANVFVDDYSTIAGSDTDAYITVYHAIEGAPVVDVINLDDNSVVIDGLGYPGTFNNNDGAFAITLPEGNYNLAVVPAGATEPIILDLSGMKFAGNNAYLVSAIGTVDNPTVQISETSLLADGFARSFGAIGDFLIDNPSFSTLVTLATAEGVNPDIAATLFDNGADLTVFAPTNGAFDNLLASLGTNADTLIQYPELIDTILLYHVADGAMTLDSITSGSIPTLLDGESVEVQVSSAGVKLDYFATIIMPDVAADNGVIQVVDEVLLPQTAVSMWNQIQREMAAEDTTEAEAAVEETVEEPAVETTTIADVAMGSDDFSTLVSLASAADPAVLELLSDPEASVTVFAPTNAAFDALLADLNIDPERLMEHPDLITTILSYHVADGAMTAEAIAEAGSIPTLVDGESIQVQVFGGGSIKLDFTANVTGADMLADNGVVHVIDQVLLPQTAVSQYNAIRAELAPPVEEEEAVEEPAVEVTTIADVAMGSDDFSTLVSLVAVADPAVLELLSNPEASVTVFAPTNAAFDLLLADLNIDPERLMEHPDLITAILLYHVADGVMTTDAIAEADSIPTLVDGESIQVQVFGDGSIKLDFTANVTGADMLADNGVVHVIDQVLLPHAAVSQYNALRAELAPPVEEGEGE